MYKVKIFSSEKEDMHFETIMPCIPKKGQNIGFWVDGKYWVIAEILSFVYEFDKKNNFDCIEITVDF